MFLMLLAIAMIVAVTLAMRRAPLWQWSVAAAVLGILSRIGVVAGELVLFTGVAGWIIALLPAAVLGLLAIPPIRRLALTGPAYGKVKAILPRISRTEQEALDAGTVGWDAELFSGRPDWSKLLGVRKPTLTAEEQAFLDGPVETVCAMIDD